jgi:inorganic pyrophosphatase
VLYDEVRFPFNYGFVAQTESGDGENLDAFVLSTHPISRGTMVVCRPVGMIELIDRGKEDHKIIAVLNNEPKWSDVQDMKDLPVEYVTMFEEFYKELARQWHHDIKITGFFGKDRAKKELLRTQNFD